LRMERFPKGRFRSYGSDRFFRDIGPGFGNAAAGEVVVDAGDGRILRSNE
jgi:hypothetical protein